MTNLDRPAGDSSSLNSDPLRERGIVAFSDGAVFGGECLVGGDSAHSADSDSVASKNPSFAVGEAVFNTAICGYQEIISDPSYCRQIVNFTHPHIGNTGVNLQDDESAAVGAAGIIVRKLSYLASNWRAEESLLDYLRRRKIAVISGVDTRAITLKLREQGALAACIAVGDNSAIRQQAIDIAKQFSGLSGMMLADEASGERAEEWGEGLWRAGENAYSQGGGRRHVAVLDCGVKRTILRQLAERDCRVTFLPYDCDWETLQAQKADGVVFSNGPGDPAPCEHAEELARRLLAQKTPLLGICLGHQIVAAALGAKTVKMKFGHHGANHPVREEASGRVLITSQNHGFAVDAASLPPSAKASHVSLFDGSLQGITADSPPVITFQGHPEASPGPHDAAFLFDNFVKLMDERGAR